MQSNGSGRNAGIDYFDRSARIFSVLCIVNFGVISKLVSFFQFPCSSCSASSPFFLLHKYF